MAVTLKLKIVWFLEQEILIHYSYDVYFNRITFILVTHENEHGIMTWKHCQSLLLHILRKFMEHIAYQLTKIVLL